MAKVRKILDAGQSWKVLTDDDNLLCIIPKAQIKSISFVRAGQIKVEHGEGCGCEGGCQELYILRADLLEPASADESELMEILIAMLGITPALATNSVQVQIREVLHLISDKLTQIDADLSGGFSTDALETLLTQTNTMIPANHLEIKNLLSDAKAFLQDILNQLEGVESAISIGNAAVNANGVTLSTILTRLTEFKTSYEDNFTAFQTNYNATSATLQTAVNNLLTQLGVVDNHIQEVRTSVDGIIPVLDVIITALGDLALIKAKVTSIDLAHALSQPSRIDQFEAGTIYRGYTITPAASDGSAVWAISKETTTAGVTSILWAGGVKDFIHSWDSRAALTYS